MRLARYSRWTTSTVCRPARAAPGRSDWRNRLATILHDDARLASERADLLRVACAERIKNVRLQHGKSREARHLELYFTRQAPEPAGQVIPVWVRDGWNDDEKSVLADAGVRLGLTAR